MPELRRDTVTGNYVVVASERAKRPTDFSIQSQSFENDVSVADCPFCPGNEQMTPLEVLAIRPHGGEPNTPGWQVRVFPNKFPALGCCDDPVERQESFRPSPADGSHEVIVHSPDHYATLATMEPGELELVFRVYRHRYHAACEDPAIRHVQFILNFGRGSGASLEHSHSQMFGVPIIPPLLEEELDGSARYMEQNGTCVFCDMIEEELKDGRRIISQGDHFVAFAPYASRFPFEICIIPRRHEPSFVEMNDGELADFAAMVRKVLGLYRDGLRNPPLNYFIHTSPCSGEYRFFHWHMELVPRLTTLGGFELGAGMLINVTPPETVPGYLIGG